MNFKCPATGTADSVIEPVNSLVRLECGPLPESYTDTCSCCPGGSSNTDSANDVDSHATLMKPKDDGCCKAQWLRKVFYRQVKAKVVQAVKEHKIFLIRGELPKLKEALEKRGWLQKYESTKTRALPYGSVASLETRSLGDIHQPDGTLNEKALVFTLLRHTPPNFIWDCRNDFDEWHGNVKSNALLNRYQKASAYTSKLGMARLLQDSHWLHEDGVSSVLFPRSYNVSREPDAFLQDFRQTAAAGLLKWFVQRTRNLVHPDVAAEDDAGVAAVQGKGPSIPLSDIEFAIKRCEEFAALAKHRDLDSDDCIDRTIDDEQWRLFLGNYTDAVHNGAGIECLRNGDQERLQSCLVAAKAVLKKLRTVDPQYELNGSRNVWIVKPSDLCCGTGITISHRLEVILRRVEDKPTDYFIVQKYIEKPLLVQGTKFDIRQWYLVTCVFPLTIWMFKEALLRFSSKPYSYSTYHEAVHICNTAVQQKYDDERRRRRKRGDSNDSGKSARDQAWDCEKLNEYLNYRKEFDLRRQNGHKGEPYYDKIYPKMAEAIVLTMLASQELMDRRSCSFELYGADFMLMEDLSVWLIEINTNPRMHPPSSRITRRLYGSVLESLVKVIIDLPMNPGADTGGFSLVYKQSIPEFHPYLGPCFFVFGKSMTLCERPPKREKERKANICDVWAKQRRAWTAPPMMPRLRDPKVVDFIEHLNAGRNATKN